MKMKKLFAFAAVAMALTACSSNEEAFVNNNFPEDGVMRFATSVSDVQTRGGYDNDNVTTKELYLWVTPKKNPKDAYIYNGILLHYDGSDWGTYSSKGSDNIYTPITLLWQDKTTPVEVTAASFGGNIISRVELDTEAKVSVSTLQKDENTMICCDYLYFKGTVNPAATEDIKAEDGSLSEYALMDGKVRLPMRHINSKLNIKVTLGTEFSVADGLGTQTSNPLTEVMVNNVYSNRRFNMKTGQFGDFRDGSGNTASPQSIALTDATTFGTWIPTTDAAKKAVASYECILVPQDVAAGKLSITFTLGGKNYQWTSAKGVKFESGYAYTLELTVGKEILTVNSLSIANWDNQPEGSVVTE